MTSAYQVYTTVKKALVVLSIAPAAIVFGAVFVGWVALAHIAEKRGRS